MFLDKAKFINTTTGVINDSAELKKAVDAAIASNPQLAALVSWEMDVLAAAGATLSALLNLVHLTRKILPPTRPRST